MTNPIIDNRTIDELRADALAGHTTGDIEEIDLAIALGYDTPQKMTVLPEHPFSPAPPNHVHIAEVYGLGEEATYLSRRLELPIGWAIAELEQGSYEIVRTPADATPSEPLVALIREVRARTAQG